MKKSPTDRGASEQNERRGDAPGGPANATRRESGAQASDRSVGGQSGGDQAEADRSSPTNPLSATERNNRGGAVPGGPEESAGTAADAKRPEKKAGKSQKNFEQPYVHRDLGGGRKEDRG